MKNKEIAELFGTIADSFMALRDIYATASEEKTQVKNTKKDKPAKQSNQAPEADAKEEAETATYTKEDVRAMLAQKAKAEGGKFKVSVKEIVAKFSSDGTLTGVPEEKYSELVADLEVVGNA